MTTLSPVQFALPALWITACLAAAVLLLLRRDRPLTAETGFLLAGFGLLALAGVVWLAVRLLGGSPSLSGLATQVVLALILFAAAGHARHLRLNPDAAASKFTYAEKSALLVLLVLACVAGDYFLGLRSGGADAAFPAFVDAVVTLVILMIAGHIVLAVFHAPAGDLDAAPDERDRSVSLRSSRNAYFALAAGFWAVPFLLIREVPLVKALNVWLAVLVAAELVYYGSVLLYYRRGTV